MSEKVLITGGTGLIGQRISLLLKEKGYEISHLSRRAGTSDSFKTYQWNVREGEMDKEAIVNADHIIHLAGAGVADSRWTEARKKEILESRTKSTALLGDYLMKTDNKVRSFISASAIGYYGSNLSDKLFDETGEAGDDFLADVTVQWEKEVDKISDLGIRTAKVRIGVVLDSQGGALEKMAQPMKWGAGAALGSGKQYMSWIHYADLARLFVYILENKELTGAYNAVASNPVSNKAFTGELAKAMRKPLWLPNVPSGVLKLMLGKMAGIVLRGTRVDNKKIKNSGFKFEFDALDVALADLLA